jgi:hypothetical protein
MTYTSPGVDRQDAETVECDVGQGDDEGIRRLGGDRSQQRGHGRAEVGSQCHRERIAQRQYSGGDQRHQDRRRDARTLDGHSHDEPGGEGARPGTPAEHVVDGVLDAAGHDRLHLVRDHPQCHEDRSDPHCEKDDRLGTSEAEGVNGITEPRDRHTDGGLDGAGPATRAGRQQVPHDLGEPRCDLGDDPEPDLQGKKQTDCHHVEVVVDRCRGERSLEVGVLADVAKRGQGVRDRGPDIGAHDQRYGCLDREHARPDQSYDRGRRHRG